MFERLRDMVHDAIGMARAEANKAGLVSYKSIFDLQGVPAYQEFYNLGIFVWKSLYKGYYKPWHYILAPTIENPQNRRNMAYLSLSKAICAELAGMVWTDQCEVSVSMEGNEAEVDPLNDFVQDVLKRNRFNSKMIECVEHAAALGGEALKVWREVRRDENGAEIPGTEYIRIGYAQADQFVPVSWDNARIEEAIFVSRVARGGYYYTLLEWHTWEGLTYVIKNELYKADRQKGGNGEAQDILGYRCPLAELYPHLEEEVRINTEASLFAYFRPSVANNIDDNSPLGVSIYANALETLHAIDICFDSFVREFRLGKKRIIVPARMIRTVTDPQTGRPVRYFDATDETYEALSTDDPDSLKIQDNSVELRVDEHVAALNAFLNILCLQIGLSAGTFSFDAHEGLKTATEVVSENSKTYKTVRNYQNQMAPAIEHLVGAIIDIAALYNMTTADGQSVAALASRGYEVSVSMDDGITQDRQTNINEGIMLVGAGLMSKLTFLTDPKYGQNMTEEDAEKELQRIKEESSISLDQFDVADYQGQERPTADEKGEM